MALYRNIAGFLDNRRVGLSLAPTPSLTIISPTTSLLPSPFTDPVAYQEQQQATQDAYRNEMIARYDWLLSHSYDDITTTGYYVTTDNGSIFQWTDPAHTTSDTYLSIDWIQQIENERGTAGTLLMHMQQPVIAKETAGYEGGSSSTFYQDNGVDPTTQVVSAPISSVQSLPPANTTSTPVSTTTTPITAASTSTAAVPKNNFLPVAVMVSIVGVAVIGERLPHRKLITLGGLGALFYLMAKNQ